MNAPYYKDAHATLYHGDCREILPFAPAVDTRTGIHLGLTFAEYERLPGLRASQLRWMSVSPLRYRHELDRATAPTDAMRLGTAVHAMVLEPERWQEIVERAPDERRSQADKGEWARIELAGRIPMRQRDIERARAMADAVAASDAARLVLLSSRPEQREVSLTWTDAIGDRPCKARLDAIAGRWVVELKTIGGSGGGLRGFARRCADSWYHVQAAHYLAGAKACGPEPRGFLFIAVDSEPPHEVAVWQLSEIDRELGERLRAKWLGELAACEASGNWPAAFDMKPDRDGQMQFPTLSLPAWAHYQIEE